MPVPVVIAFTESYFIPAATCLQSMLAHTTADSKFRVICLLTEDLSESKKEALRLLDAKGQIDYTFIRLDEADLGKDIYVDPRYTIAASYRLMIASILPQYDKIIYTDCDIIIRTDIARLYRETQFADEYVAAVYESPLPFQDEHIRKVGCTPGKYFNSGFLLMNLAKIREEHVEERFMNELRTDYLEFPDQDVLNKVCQGRVKPLAPIYNGIRTFFLPQYREYFLLNYTENDLAAVHESGTIHYTGSKPWQSFTVMFYIWWKYYYTLPQAVRREGQPNIKWKLTYDLVFSHALGRGMVEAVRYIYRKIR